MPSPRPRALLLRVRGSHRGVECEVLSFVFTVIRTLSHDSLPPPGEFALWWHKVDVKITA